MVVTMEGSEPRRAGVTSVCHTRLRTLCNCVHKYFFPYLYPLANKPSSSLRLNTIFAAGNSLQVPPSRHCGKDSWQIVSSTRPQNSICSLQKQHTSTDVEAFLVRR